MISEDRLVDGVFIFCTSCTNILLARPWNAVRRVWTAPEAKGALDTFVKETLFHFAGPLNAFFVYRQQLPFNPQIPAEGPEVDCREG
jgi:hypothetical protein